MDAIIGLQKMMQEAEVGSSHHGYWYRVSESLIIMVCGMLCGMQTIGDIHEWAKAKPAQSFLKDRFWIEGVPCRAQFYNILACVDAEKFSRSFIKWMQGVLQGSMKGKTVAIDGKTICSTDKLTADGNALHIASAIVSEYGMVIGSKECGTKTGEIAAFRELIELLEISGAMVVADALHCHKKSAKTVVAAGADYLFAVKDNHPSLREDIELYFQNEKVETFTTVEKNGGRVERRTGHVSHDLKWLAGREELENLACIGAIHTEFEKSGHKSSEWHYYISSAPLTAEGLLKHARLEWGVESMHWLLDVHFTEDKTRVWNMNVQKLLNTMRKIALNLSKDYKAKSGSKVSISGVLKRNLFDLTNLAQFLDVLMAN